MRYRLKMKIDLPATDCEDTANTVEIIVSSLHHTGRIASTDHISFTDNGETITVWVYEPVSNGEG